jgi:hypothetical protein
MKKTFQSVNQVRTSFDAFSRFSGCEILSSRAMNCVRGGTADGGGSETLPPPTKP